MHIIFYTPPHLQTTHQRWSCHRVYRLLDHYQFQYQVRPGLAAPLKTDPPGSGWAGRSRGHCQSRRSRVQADTRSARNHHRMSTPQYPQLQLGEYGGVWEEYGEKCGGEYGSVW